MNSLLNTLTIFSIFTDINIILDLSNAEEIEWDRWEHSDFYCEECATYEGLKFIGNMTVDCLHVDNEYLSAPRDCSTPINEDPTPDFFDTSSDIDESVEAIFESRGAMSLDRSVEILFDTSEERMDESHLWQPMLNLSFVTGSPCSMELPDYSWHPSMAPSPTYGSDRTPSPSDYAATSPPPSPPAPMNFQFFGTVFPENLALFPELNVQYGVWRNELGHVILSQYFNN